MSFRSWCLVVLMLVGCETHAPTPQAASTQSAAVVTVSLASIYDVEQTLKKWKQLTSEQRSDVQPRLLAEAKKQAAKARKSADLVPWMEMLRRQLAVPAAVDALAALEARFDALASTELSAAESANDLGVLLHNAVILRRTALVGRIGVRLDPLCKLKKRTLDLPKYVARYLCATQKTLFYAANRGSDGRAAHAVPLVVEPVQKRLGRKVDTQRDDPRALVRLAVEALSPPVHGRYPCEVTAQAVHDDAISAVYKGACVAR